MEWLDVLASYFPTDSESLQKTTLTDIEKNPTWDG